VAAAVGEAASVRHDAQRAARQLAAAEEAVTLGEATQQSLRLQLQVSSLGLFDLVIFVCCLDAQKAGTQSGQWSSGPPQRSERRCSGCSGYRRLNLAVCLLVRLPSLARIFASCAVLMQLDAARIAPSGCQSF
jgi:hypothetical protein